MTSSAATHRARWLDTPEKRWLDFFKHWWDWTAPCGCEWNSRVHKVRKDWVIECDSCHTTWVVP